MEKFMFIFRNEMQVKLMYEDFSPEEMQAELQKWNNWIGGIDSYGCALSSR